MLRSILGLAVLANAAGAQVLNLAELSAEQIRALDRAKTVVLLPGGILEQHGPHLPSYTDGYQNERMTSALARAVAARPGWKALVFPMIPLGTGGANEIGGKFSWPGTYAVRTATLRAVFMDLADELGEQGFRWAFIINGHGAPSHNRALDEVEDYFRDTYDGRMVHLSGRDVDMSAHDAEYRRHITPAIRQADADSPHSGVVETSVLAYLRPDLISPTYRQLADLSVDRDATVNAAKASAWAGYFGAPRLATADIGRFLFETKTAEHVKLAMRILDGFDERSVPRYADVMLAIPAARAVSEQALEQERARAKRQQDWMDRNARR